MKNYLVRHRSAIGFLLCVMLVGGGYAFTQLQTALFPDVTFPKIKIIADNGEQPVDKMMVIVTKPLENAIKMVPNLKMLRSTTSRGSCEISAIFDWDSDMDISQSLIEAKINEIRNNLPATAQITVEKMNPSILPVMGYTLESNTKNPIELKLIANTIVKPFLSQVEGVSSIRIMGGKTKEYWVQPDARKMSSFGITPDTIATVMNQTNFITSNGYVSDYRRMYLTVTDAMVHNIDELGELVIKNNGKRIIRLKDVAEVLVSNKLEYIRINANGKDAILVNVLKQPNTNLIALARDVDARVKKLQAILPQGVSIKPYYDQSDFVSDAIRSVSDSLWMGLALAIFVAILFLRSFKASLTILITIPVTLGFTLIVLYILGYTFNIMTLGAIAAAIGLIIDDAIVVVEQIHRTHEEHPLTTTRALIHKAISYLFPAMLGSSISTIVIFIPFVMMSGVAGAYFKVLTNTMIITLACSFFVTWFGLPVIYMLLGRKEDKTKEQKAHRISPKKWVSFFIRRPIISLVIIGGFVTTIIMVYPMLETGFLPEMDEGSIVLDYNSPPGTSLAETDRMLREVEALLVKVPEVTTYSRRTGTQMGFFITEPNRGDYLIQLKKKRNRTTEQVIDDIRKQIESTQPGLRVDFGQVIGDMLGDLMVSVQPIEIKIFGDNQAKLNELAEEVTGKIEKIKGVADAFNGIVIAGPSVVVNPHPAKLAQYGISPTNFQFQLQTQLEGSIIGNMPEKEQLTDIRLLYPGLQDASVERMRQASIFLPGGKLKPITELADIELKEGVAEINRENLQSMAVVTARLNGRGLGSVMKEIQQKIDASIHLPQGYHISYGGAYAEQEKSFSELLTILLTASFLVFTVMLLLFGDLRVAFSILLIAVLGVAGSYLALYITHTPLNVGSYTGMIMIIGIIGENAIFTYQQFAANLAESSVDESIIYSISTRLRPKLMTAFGAIIALMPLALGIGTGAQLHQPLAIAVIGGFVAALPLLLIVFPSLLRLFLKKKRFSYQVEE